MPTATGMTGVPKFEPARFRSLSVTMRTTARPAPAQIIGACALRPSGENSALLSVAIRLACGAGMLPSRDAAVAPEPSISVWMTGAMAKADVTAPTMIMTCCFQGVAPSMRPALRSCRLSPEMDAATQMTAAMMTAVGGPMLALTPKASKARHAVRSARMVMPLTGLLLDPTMPAR